MKKLFYFFFLLPTILCAQINESDSLNFKAKLSLTGFWQGGNVQTLIFRANSEMSFKPFEKWVFKTKNSYVFQEFGGDKADEDFLSLNFLYLNPERRFYPLVLAFVSTNFRREIDVRSLFGVGFSYQVIDESKSKHKNWLKMSLTTEYEQTRFKKTDFNIVAYNNNSDINTFRSTLWVNGKYNLFKKKMILTHEMYFQPSLEEGDNFRWRADVGVEFPIWKHLNFKINYLRTYESIVIARQEQEDEFLTFGLTLKSY